MGFTQLLAANRSLRNINSGPSRYKMNQANVLPKFGMEKSSKPEGLPAEPAGRSLALPPAEPEPVASVAPMLSPATPRSTSPSTEMQATANQQLNGIKPSAKPARLTGWMRFRNPFGLRQGNAQPVAAVQAELLLDTVKPVRNDLGNEEFASSARLTKGPAPTPVKSPFAPAVIRSTETPGLWRRWKDRVFGRRSNRPQG